MSIDLKEVGNMIKSNPKMFGAELVNMLMADPWLLFMPLGWGRLGRGVFKSTNCFISASFCIKFLNCLCSKNSSIKFCCL